MTLPPVPAQKESELTRNPICGQRYSHYGTISPYLVCGKSPDHRDAHSCVRDGIVHAWPRYMSDAIPPRSSSSEEPE